MNDWDIIHSSKNHDWRTPPHIFSELDKEFRFDIDAAASPVNALCDHYWTVDDNSLSIDWSSAIISSQGTPPVVFVNPPYGRTLSVWVDKIVEQQRKGCTVVAVLMACTDTRWWSTLWEHATEIRFVTGRVRFLNSDGQKQNSAPKGTAIVVFRPYVSTMKGPYCSLVTFNERDSDTESDKAGNGSAR